MKINLSSLSSKLRSMRSVRRVAPGIRVKLSFFTGLFVSAVLLTASFIHYFHQTEILEESYSARLEPSLRYINSVVVDFENVKSNLILMEDMKVRISEKKKELKKYKRVLYKKRSSLLNNLKGIGSKLGMTIRYDYAHYTVDTAYSVYLSDKEISDLEKTVRSMLRHPSGRPVSDRDFASVQNAARVCAVSKRSLDSLAEEVRELNKNVDVNNKKLSAASLKSKEYMLKAASRRYKNAAARLHSLLRPYYEYPLQKIEEAGLYSENTRILASDLEGNVSYDTGVHIKGSRLRFAPLLKSGNYLEGTKDFFTNYPLRGFTDSVSEDYLVDNREFSVERRPVYRDPSTYERAKLILDEQKKNPSAWKEYLETDMNICGKLALKASAIEERSLELRKEKKSPAGDNRWRNLYREYEALLIARGRAFSKLNPYRNKKSEIETFYKNEINELNKYISESQKEISILTKKTAVESENSESNLDEIEKLSTAITEARENISRLSHDLARSMEHISDSYELSASDAFQRIREAALYDFIQIRYGSGFAPYSEYTRSSAERARAAARWKTIRSWITEGGSETSPPATVPGYRGMSTLGDGVLAYGRSEAERYMWMLDSTPVASAVGYSSFETGDDSLIGILLRGTITGCNTVLIDKSEGLEKIRYNTRLLVIYSSATGIFAVLLAWFFAGLMLNRLRGITDQAKLAEQGDLKVLFPERGMDEIENLAVSLNTMMSGLREREEMKSEITAAGEIQKQLLPDSIPENLKGVYSIGSYYKAMSGVGGDYYDFIELDEHRLLFCIADVSNHGVGPALVMAMLRAHLRGIVNKGVDDLREILLELNSMLFYDTPHHIFVTFFIGIADKESHTITCSSAGHLRPIIYRYNNSEIESPAVGGLPLGMDDNSFFDETISIIKITMKPGDLFFQYTDGITEAMNENREQFGEDRLKSILKDSARKKTNLMIDAVYSAAASFSGIGSGSPSDQGPGDDMAMIALKRLR